MVKPLKLETHIYEERTIRERCSQYFDRTIHLYAYKLHCKVDHFGNLTAKNSWKSTTSLTGRQSVASAHLQHHVLLDDGRVCGLIRGQQLTDLSDQLVRPPAPVDPPPAAPVTAHTWHRHTEGLPFGTSRPPSRGPRDSPHLTQTHRGLPSGTSRPPSRGPRDSPHLTRARAGHQ